MGIDKINQNNLWKYTIESECLQLDVFPALGGKLTSIFNKRLGKEFLWNNKDLPLQMCNVNDDYDSNFWGGIDELIPNDIIENIDGVDCPDHGELWTTALDCSVTEMRSRLAVNYQKVNCSIVSGLNWTQNIL